MFTRASPFHTSSAPLCRLRMSSLPTTLAPASDSSAPLAPHAGTSAKHSAAAATSPPDEPFSIFPPFWLHYFAHLAPPRRPFVLATAHHFFRARGRIFLATACITTASPARFAKAGRTGADGRLAPGSRVITALPRLRDFSACIKLAAHRLAT
jgi:hypothetical protein